MTIWVDVPIWPAHGRLWCHVISDQSLAELHTFAADAGIPQRSFEGDHYDVPEERRAEIIQAGARPATGGDLARRLAASGLRFRKRRGDRPLGRYADGLVWLEVRHTLDVVASQQEPPEPATAAVVVVTGGFPPVRVLLVRSAGRTGWAPPGGKREPGEQIRQTAVRELAEETGLVVPPVALAPLGYERITIPPGHRLGTWIAGDNILAVYGVAMQGNPPVAAQAQDALQAQWVDLLEARRRCGEEPWWQLVERQLG